MSCNHINLISIDTIIYHNCLCMFKHGFLINQYFSFVPDSRVPNQEKKSGN